MHYPMFRIPTFLFSIFLLSGCSDSAIDQQTPSALAPELEGILVTSSAPIVMDNLSEQNVYLYFISIDCESCWENLRQMNKIREQLNLVGVVMSEDNMAVYERSREHFINLLPIYADHDENIAYDYDVEKAPMWVTVESGTITMRSSEPPSEIAERVTIQ